MEDELPVWARRLAVEVYGVIRQYNAMLRFRQMVDECLRKQEGQVEHVSHWERQRQAHFEEAVLTDERLRDKAAEPPEEGWEWEYYRRGVPEFAEGTTRVRDVIEVEAWVPPELTASVRPEVTPLLPLRRERPLNLAEKYTCLALIYDYARRGTEEIPSWPWSGPIGWGDPKAMANATKYFVFEAMCQVIPELESEQEDWLRTLLEDVEKDVAQWNRRSKRMRFAVSALLALAGLVGPAFLCGRLLPSHLLSLSQWEGMALSLSGALLLWIWVVDFGGAANSALSDWPPFAAVHKLRLWLSLLFSAIFLTSVTTYIGRLLSSR